MISGKKCCNTPLMATMFAYLLTDKLVLESKYLYNESKYGSTHHRSTYIFQVIYHDGKAGGGPRGNHSDYLRGFV